MEIKKTTAKKLVKKEAAREVGTVIHDGWRWMAVERMDTQTTDHYRIERVAD